MCTCTFFVREGLVYCCCNVYPNINKPDVNVNAFSRCQNSSFGFAVKNCASDLKSRGQQYGPQAELQSNYLFHCYLPFLSAPHHASSRTAFSKCFFGQRWNA